MGMMLKGQWTNTDRLIAHGAFVRPASNYDGDIGPDTLTALAAEPGRFHLIASRSCPWSHRTTVMHTLQGLAPLVPLQIAHGPRIQGYSANGGKPWLVPGSDREIIHMHELYALSDPSYSGRVSVPVLWDSQRQRIVSNESAKIMRAFDAVPNQQAPTQKNGEAATYLPDDLRSRIDRLNASLQTELSNAVYRAGLAQSQSAYDLAVQSVFAMLDFLETRLATRRYLFGAIITESDWQLFPTLARFDAVYHSHFRCTRHRLVDYPNLWAYARDLRSWRGIAATVDLPAILEGYYRNDGVHNPFSIVAEPAAVDWRTPHGRERLGPAWVVRRNGEVAEIDPASLELRDL